MNRNVLTRSASKSRNVESPVVQTFSSRCEKSTALNGRAPSQNRNAQTRSASKNRNVEPPIQSSVFSTRREKAAKANASAVSPPKKSPAKNNRATSQNRNVLTRSASKNRNIEPAFVQSSIPTFYARREKAANAAAMGDNSNRRLSAPRLCIRIHA